MSPTELVGRDAELALTGSLVHGLAEGRPFVLTVRGERGSGRSALLDGVREQATGAGVQVVRAGGIDGRADPPFATLSTLLRPLAADLDGSTPGSDALRAAIDLSAPPPPADDVRRAALQLLTTAARRQPVVLLLDDVDRIDEASLDVVAFVLGRLGVDAVAAIAAGTPTDGPLDAVRTHSLPLPGLAHDALTRVAAATAPCTDEVARTVASWAEGSPLLATELTRSLTADERDGTVPLPDAPRPTVWMVDRLQRELDSLDPPLQRALVVAAADRTGSVEVITRALVDLGEPAAALDAVEASDLVAVSGGTVRFRHELLRPLAYRLVASASRRAAHRALAAALIEPAQAAERVRQLVASTAGPDESVAGLLDLVATAHRNRGEAEAAARTSSEAARLSVDPAARGRRLLDAARAHLDAGDVGAARTAAETAAGSGATDAAEVLAHIDGRAAPEGLAAVLSAAELRVAEAVASGLTNRQAADTLFLSAKTVDFHLQSIYRKLAIRSRAELATLVATKGARR